MECAFCKIISGEIPTSKLYEDNTVIVTFEINPSTIGHMLVIPKAHYETIEDIPPQDYLNIMSVVRFFTSLLKEALSAKGFNVLLNVGEVKNQQNKHLLIHIIPSSASQEIAFQWKPIKPNQEEFISLAKTLQQAMARKLEEARAKMKEHSGELLHVEKGTNPNFSEKIKKEVKEQKEEKKEEKKETKPVKFTRGYA